MKYLKKFNESSIPMIDSNNIGDILMDIIDIGYKCYVKTDWWSDGSNNIDITIYGLEEFDKSIHCNVNYIYIDDVIETINRLFDYLKSEGYNPNEISKKTAEAIKLDPEEFGVKGRTGEIKIDTGKVYNDGSKSSITFIKDKEKNKWKINNTIGFYFKQN